MKFLNCFSQQDQTILTNMMHLIIKSFRTHCHHQSQRANQLVNIQHPDQLETINPLLQLLLNRFHHLQIIIPQIDPINSRKGEESLGCLESNICVRWQISESICPVDGRPSFLSADWIDEWRSDKDEPAPTPSLAS